MAITIDYPFDSAANYSFDNSLIEVSGSKARLKKIDETGLSFNEDFATDAGFTYDNTKAEFTSGKVQQKDQRPVNALMYMPFTVDSNPVWGSLITGNLSGGASVSGGLLNLTGQTTKQLTHSKSGNWDSFGNSGQTGWIEFDLIPDWATGNPPSNQNILEASGSGNKNMLAFFIDTIGRLKIEIRDNAGGSNIYYSSAQSWVNGQSYKIALGYDTTGTSRAFIDGTQVWSQNTSSITTDNNNKGSVYWCRSGSGDLFLDNILWFSAPRFTANYTVPSNPAETIYVTSVIDLPTFTYSALGDIQAFVNYVTTEAGTPRYVFNSLYWDGSAWVSSDDSYAQANTKADLLANIATLPVVDVINISIVFNNGDTISSVDDLTLSYTGQFYSVANPTIEVNSGFYGDKIESLVETVIKAGSDDIKYVIKVGAIYYYAPSGVPTITTGLLYTESSSVTDWTTAFLTWDPALGVVFKVKSFLHSDDNTTTPELDNLKLTYDSRGNPPDTVETCLVYGNSKNPDSSGDILPITVELTRANVKYKTNINIIKETYTVTPKSDGYWEIDLVENINMSNGVQYKFTINGIVYVRTVPNLTTQSFWDLAE